MISNPGRPPRWLAVVIIVCMLPVFSLPALLPTAPESLRTLIWLYPFYVVCTGCFAWLCWNERPWLTWILLALMILSHMAVWMLATMPEV